MADQASLMGLSPENIAFLIRKAESSNYAPIAFVSGDEGVVYYSVRNREPFEPSSALVELIQGLWDKFYLNAFSVVRNRIYTTSSLTEMDHGIIKVCAKRVQSDVQLQAPEAETNLKLIKIETQRKTPKSFADERLDLDSALKKAKGLASKTQPQEAKYESDRAIGAVLLDEEGRVLAQATNEAGQNRTRHAEVVLLQDYFARTQKPIPKNAVLVTTLKPCKMCAGMLWTAAQDPLSLKVFYEEFDSGPMGAITVLTKDSFERHRACSGDKKSAEIEMEFKIKEGETF